MEETPSTPKLVWIWQKQPIELKKCEDGQLNSIHEALIKSKKKKWFNISSKIWLKEVNRLIKIKNNENTNNMINHIVKRRLHRNLPNAIKNAEVITNGIVKIMNKTNKTN